MSSETVLGRAEKSMSQLRKEQATLEDMRRVARESLAYLKLERAALDEVLHSKVGFDENEELEDDEMPVEGVELDTLQLLELSSRGGIADGDVDLSKLLCMSDGLGSVSGLEAVTPHSVDLLTPGSCRSEGAPSEAPASVRSSGGNVDDLLELLRSCNENLCQLDQIGQPAP